MYSSGVSSISGIPLVQSSHNPGQEHQHLPPQNQQQPIVP